MALITPRIREICNETPPPYKTLEWAIVPHPDGDPCLLLTFNVRNWVTFSDPQQSSIAEWAGAIVTKIRAEGIPCYMAKVETIDEM